MELLRDLLLAIAGPIGIFLGWWLPRRDKAEDRSDKKLELRRAKAEEIYQEMEIAALEAQRAFSQAAKLLTPDEARLEPIVTSLGKLRGLVAIYFPDGNELFAANDKNTLEIGKWVREQLQSGPSGSLPSADAVTAITFAYITQLQMAATAFLKELRSFMDEQVRTLS